MKANKPVCWTIDAWYGKWTKIHLLRTDGITLCGRNTNSLPFWRKPFPVNHYDESDLCSMCRRIKASKKEK